MDPTTLEHHEPNGPPSAVAVDGLGWFARRRVGRAVARRQEELTAITTAKVRRLADVEVARAEDALAEERRVHALQVAEEERARAAQQEAEDADNADATAKKRSDRRYQRFARRRSLAATLVIIALSLATAIPAQVKWFISAPRSLGPLGFTLALLIELLCWLGAFLYADAVDDNKVGLARLYRGMTWVFAAVAATINFAHGMETNFFVGVGYAMASLMGVGAFEVYMHRTRHRKSGLTAAEIRVLALRRWHFRAVVKEQYKLRAVFGVGVPDETLWRIAYLKVQGNPVLPVPISALFVPLTGDTSNTANGTPQEIAAAPEVELTPEPSSPEPAAHGSVLVLAPEGDANTPAAEDPTVDMPVDWDGVETYEALLGRFWPDLGSHAPAEVSEQPANTEPADASEVDAISANTANTDPEHAPDPYAPLPVDTDPATPVKQRLRAYYERVRSLGVDPEDLDWRHANTACGGSERYAQMQLKEYREELAANEAANTTPDPGQGIGGTPELR